MRLKDIRQSRKLTQQQVADLLCIPLRTYQNYEREVNEPETSLLCKLADYYGVSVDYLVGYSDIAIPVVANKQSLTDREQSLINSFRQLNDKQQDALLTVALAMV